MEDPRIAIIVDHPLRDLPGLVLLAAKLCQAGVVCHLVPMNLQKQEVGALVPDFLLVNYLRSANEAFVREVLGCEIPVGVLETEGGVLSSFDHYRTALARDEGTRRGIACYCSWGPELARHAVEAGWYAEEQVVVTGAPRYDFYARPWREAATAISPYLTRFRKPIILLNSNFSWANPGFRTPEKEAELLATSGFHANFIHKSQALQLKTLEGFVQLANHLSARLPDFTFIFRPHPFENLETYQRLLEPRANLHLIRHGSVDGWILQSAAVLQRGCSTAIEAGLAGVPAISPAWLPLPFPLDAPEAVSIQCASEVEVAEWITGLSSGRVPPPDSIQASLRKVISDWFYKIDGSSHERVALAITKALRTGVGASRLTSCHRMAHGFVKEKSSMAAKISSRIRMHLGLPPSFSLRRWKDVRPGHGRWERSLKHFDVDTVRPLVSALSIVATRDGRPDWAAVGVASACERSDYKFAYRGRSVTLFPARAR